jgi:Lamin Tail Domain
MTGACADGGVVINELAGSGGDFIELFNASDSAFDLSGYGVTDSNDAGIRYATSLRFPSNTTIAARGYFTISLEADCPATVTPCLRGEFGLSQSQGDLVTFLDPQNATVAQQAYPANAAPSGQTWGRVYDGASSFEVQTRSPGAANAQ